MAPAVGAPEASNNTDGHEPSRRPMPAAAPDRTLRPVPVRRLSSALLAPWKEPMLFRSLKTFLAIVTCFAVLASGPVGVRPRSSAAAAELSREYLIKAAFLYNFAKFTDWPASAFATPDMPLTICVIGEDPFGAALDAIDGKEIKGRIVAVRRPTGETGADSCHVIFISASERPRLAGILGSLRDRPVLTVADMPDFARAGGIINLKTNKEDRIRFDINIGRAQQAGLRMSSKLLSLAEDTYN